MKAFLGFVALLFFTLPARSQSWELLTPMNTGDIVRNCSFLDEQNGYSVLFAVGVVLKTTDGGNTWSRPWTPGISTNLYDVEMVSLDTVFTAGLSGEIFRSTDEGESFQEMSTPTSEVLYALEFINSEVGFAAGFNGVILKTTDGGSTWELKPSGTTSRLYDIEFVNETTGFACGWNGTVIKTTDGGETWQGLNTEHSGALFNCTFPSEQVGYACGWSQTILKTSDGGATWEVQNDGSNNTLNYIEFKDELNGWAGGDFGALFTTTNGGQTWNSSNPFGSSAIWSGQYVNDNAAFLMGNGIMIKSQNGGANWELLKTGVPNATYHGLYFLSDNVGYAAGAVGGFAEGTNQSGIVFTEDGGQTWQQQAIGFSGGWQDVHFSDENNGTVIGGGSFGKTTNGGENWVFGNIPFDLTGRCSWFFNSTEGVIGGQGVFSSVCRTDNGGSSYNCQDNTLATDFYFTSDLNGWAVAEASTENVLHTIDGGVNWLYVPTGNTQTKHSVFFLNENHGWIGAANGSVLRTTDGGSTWNVSNAAFDVVGIHFYNEQIGFCVNNQGSLFKSEDGGASWDLFLSGDDPTMHPIEEAYFTENNVYISGWGGDIYKAGLGCTEIAPAQILSANEWCVGEQNTIGFSSTTPVVDFEWQFPEGWTAEVNFNSVNLTAGVNSGEIQITTFNVCGLSATSQFTVQVLPDVEEVTALTYPASICSNESFEVEIVDPQGGVEYQWTFPLDWDVEVTGAVAMVASSSGSGMVTVIGLNSCGVSPAFQETIEIFSAPELSFSLPESVCDNLLFELEAAPLGGEFTGEGVQGGIFDPTSLESDVVEITYTYVSSDNCAATVTQTLNLIPSEITGGAWSVFNYPSCGGELMAEISGLENFDDWSLDFPEDWGDVVDLGTDAISFEIDGVFSDGELLLTVTNACDVELEFTNAVHIEALPEMPVLQSSSSQWCDGDEGQVVFEVVLPDSLQVLESALEYELFHGDSLASLTLTGEPGEYFLTVFVENVCGTSEDTTLMLVIQELPEIAFSLPADTVCTSDLFPFSMDPEGGEIEGEGVIDGTLQSYMLEPFQSHDFTYTYTDENGCTNSAFLSIYVDICENVPDIEPQIFQIYPNPASNYLIVESDLLLPQPFAIHDMAGREVSRGNIVLQTQPINVEHFTPGMYFIRTGEIVRPFLVR